MPNMNAHQRIYNDHNAHLRMSVYSWTPKDWYKKRYLMPWLHNLCRSALAVAVLTTALRGHLCRWNCINRNHSITANLWCKHGFFWVRKPVLPVPIFYDVCRYILLLYDMIYVFQRKRRVLFKTSGWLDGSCCFQLLLCFWSKLIHT